MSAAKWAAEAATARALGESGREARALSEYATAAIGDRDVVGAGRALERAAALFAQLGDNAEEAKTRYGMAILLARVRPGHAAILENLGLAESAARRAGDPRLVGRVLDRQAALLCGQQRYADAAAKLAEVAEILERLGDHENRLDTLRRLAMLVQLAGQPERALELLAAAMVGGAPSSAQMLRARLELQLLGRQLGATTESLEGILADAVKAGDHGAAGYLQLQLAGDAIQGGRLPRGAWYTAEAKKSALECTDPILYLLASMMLAEIQEKEDDRLGVLNTLFTCKATLEDLLGQSAATPVLAVIHTVEQRWGEEAFGAVMERYRAQFR